MARVWYSKIRELVLNEIQIDEWFVVKDNCGFEKTFRNPKLDIYNHSLKTWKYHEYLVLEPKRLNLNCNQQ